MQHCRKDRFRAFTGGALKVQLRQLYEQPGINPKKAYNSDIFYFLLARFSASLIFFNPSVAPALSGEMLKAFSSNPFALIG
jgi:hypothetical protein